jgi:hypothetical protein
MLRSLAKFSESEASNHAPYWADFIVNTFGFRFSVHTMGSAAMSVDRECPLIEVFG